MNESSRKPMGAFEACSLAVTPALGGESTADRLLRVWTHEAETFEFQESPTLTRAEAIRRCAWDFAEWLETERSK